MVNRDLRKETDEQLIAGYKAAASTRRDCLIDMAERFVEMKRRNIVPRTMVGKFYDYLPAVAAGTLLPEALDLCHNTRGLIEVVAQMPLAVQKTISAVGYKVPVVYADGKARKLTLHSLVPEIIKRALSPSGPIPVEKQIRPEPIAAKPVVVREQNIPPSTPEPIVAKPVVVREQDIPPAEYKPTVVREHARALPASGDIVSTYVDLPRAEWAYVTNAAKAKFMPVSEWLRMGMLKSGQIPTGL